jgi:hypothetical protein
MLNLLKKIIIWFGFTALAILLLGVIAIIAASLFMVNAAHTSATLFVTLIVTQCFLAPSETHVKRWGIIVLFVIALVGFFQPALGALVLSMFFTFWWKAARFLYEGRKSTR